MPPEPMDEDEEDKKPIKALDEGDIALLKTYVRRAKSTHPPGYLSPCLCALQGVGPYNQSLLKVEANLKTLNGKINDLVGIKESDTGLSPPAQWDLVSDKQMMQEEQPLQAAPPRSSPPSPHDPQAAAWARVSRSHPTRPQVARCTKIINANTDDQKYVINVKQIAKFVVGLGDRVAPADVEEGMRVGVDRNKYQIQIPLPPKIDPTVHPPLPHPLRAMAVTAGHAPRPLLASSPSRPSGYPCLPWCLVSPGDDDDGRGEARHHVQRHRRQ